jgi:hypothetical protein
MTKEGREILEDEARLILDVLPDTRGIVGADVIGRGEVKVTRTEVEDVARGLLRLR